MLRMFTEIQCPTMSETGIKVCVGCGSLWWLKPSMCSALLKLNIMESEIETHMSNLQLHIVNKSQGNSELFNIIY